MTALGSLFNEELSPLFRLRPQFMYSDAIFNELTRARLQNQSVKIFIPSDEKTSAINQSSSPKEVNEFLYQNMLKDFVKEMKLDITHASKNLKVLSPKDLLNSFPEKIQEDINLLDKSVFETVSHACFVQGNQKNFYRHPSASISQNAVIDVESGPVVIDAMVKISAFSIITGPAYVGPESMLDRVSFSNSRCGTQCRLGGEISDSIMGDYVNKHHEGFLGHSLLGDWINLGALSTTSDLKNNYGVIRLFFEGKKVETGLIKFGSIFADFVKTGIGTMLNTGTIIDTGSLLFLPIANKKYYPPFYWGGTEEKKYSYERFIKDIEKIMARRSKRPNSILINALDRLYKNKV